VVAQDDKKQPATIADGTGKKVFLNFLKTPVFSGLSFLN
jgi:hypothetical protein